MMPMREKRIWFGNRRRMQWVKAWAEAPSLAALAYSELAQWSAGVATLDTSLDSSGDFTFQWNADTPDALEFVHAYRNGRYGRELIYWTDPMYAHRNLLPARWATPWIAADDAIPLIRRAQPTAVENTDFTREYPAFGAQYAVQAGDEAASIMVPIPPGYTAWVGVHGDSAADGKVIVTPYEGLTAGAPTACDVLGITTTTRVNHSFPGTGQSWIELRLDTSETATFTLFGLIVQVLKTGTAPTPGGFIEGMGHSGCRIQSITPQPINSALDRAAVVARFVEVGAGETYA